MKLLLAALAIGFFAAPAAHADPGPDWTYLDGLHDQGITYQSADTIISYGRGVCVMLKYSPFDEVVDAVAVDIPNLPRVGVEGIATHAVEAYCPWFAGKLPPVVKS